MSIFVEIVKDDFLILDCTLSINAVSTDMKHYKLNKLQFEFQAQALMYFCCLRALIIQLISSVGNDKYSKSAFIQYREERSRFTPSPYNFVSIQISPVKSEKITHSSTLILHRQSLIYVSR